MKLASTMHTSSVQIPFNLGINWLKSCSTPCPKNVPHRFVLRGTHSLSGGCACGRKYYRLAPALLNSLASSRSKRGRHIAYSEREQEASTSATEASRYPSPNDIHDNEISCNDSATSGETASRSADYASSLRTVGLCVISAIVFGVGLGFKDGFGKASEFFAGYLLEQSLSVDNIFVFVLVFKYLKVPPTYQNRVLSYGIAGAIIFRLSLILLGTATIQKFEAVNLFLAVILLYSSFKLFAEEDEDTDLSENFIVKTCQKFIPVTANYDGNRFITTQNGAWQATPLLLTVVVIELSDIAFAVDSIPAVFGVTRDPFVVFSSNLFAILGLRSYYTLIADSMADLEYLQPSIGVVLGFIGCKMILDFFGFHITTEVSLGLVSTTLLGGVMLSLIKKSD